MEFSRIAVLYFSPCGSTAAVAERIGSRLSALSGTPACTFDFTLPAARADVPSFSSGDLVVFGTPVYIGRVPNLLAPFFGRICGYGAVALPVTVYGNRNFDDSLLELSDMLSGNGFVCPAAAAFVGEHSFSRKLAAGRPDMEDLSLCDAFADKVWKLLSAAGSLSSLGNVSLPGRRPYEYYAATDNEGNRIDIRKVKPVTDPALCDGCGVCAASCPVGSIDFLDFGTVNGICMKCGACVKKCHSGAKSFTDRAYLSHLEQLETRFGPVRKCPEFFFLSE